MIEQGKGELLKMYKFVKSTILESGLIKKTLLRLYMSNSNF